MSLRKEESADLRKTYPIYVQVGLVVALLLLIVAFRIDIQTNSDFEAVVQEQEVVEMEEIQQTEQQVEPPPPPRPPVPMEVPNDQVLEDTEVDFDASLDFDEPAPPPPPPEDTGEGEEQEQEIFMVVEQQPELVGGQEALYDEIEYPNFARRSGIEGTVFIQFIVNEDGSVVEPTVLRSPHDLLSEEALRVIRLMTFTPGEQRGEAVRVRMSLPIRFQLQ